MNQTIWGQFWRRRAGNPRRHASLGRAKPTRFRTERLEDRLLMAVDAAANETTLASALIPNDSQIAAVATSTDRASTAKSTTLSAEVPEPDWAQFGSKAAFEAWMIEAATAQYGHLFGKQTGDWDSWWPGGGLVVFRAFATDAILFTSDYSTTNLQVAGVDEADLIETDGSYLYILSGEDLVIVQAGVGDDLRVMSRFHIGGRPVGMFLAGDRLAIVSEPQHANYFGDGSLRFAAFDAMYGYEPTPPKTIVTTLDIGNRMAPSLVQKAEMDGQLVAARVVDGELRLVLNNQLRFPPPIRRPVTTQAPNPTDIVLTEPPYLTFLAIDTADLRWVNPYGQQYVYETQEEYSERVRDTILDSVLPRIRNLAQDGRVLSDRLLVDAAKLYRPDSSFVQSITTIATFDLASNRRGPLATASVLTSGVAQVHATADDIYVFAPKPFEPNTTDSLYLDLPKTNVWKFNLEGGRNGVKLAARGSFEGTLLNQFSVDEHDGHLRVVTENQPWSQAGHGVHVLTQVGRRLEVVGSVDGIASNERLYSVRFLGDRAFFVTFRQTDPLFAVDLSDPANPRLMGELHIPGYSDYLQPIDETHLLAIGRGADESTGAFEDLQVSIFDISDLANPRLLHRYSFEGGRSTATPATGDRWTRGDGDHHAVSYFSDQQTLAFPIFTADDWNAENGTLFPVGEGGLQVFTLDIDAGFTSLGIVEHDTLVERSVRIGERLFAISSGTVSVHELDNPTMRLGEVSIAAPPDAQRTEFVVQPWLPLESSRFLPLVFSSLETTIDKPLTESSTLPADSKRTTELKAAPPVGWASSSPTHIRTVQPTAPSKTAKVSFQRRVDPSLIDLLAVHSVSRESSSDIKHDNENTSTSLFAGSIQAADDIDSLRSKSAIKELVPNKDSSSRRA